METYRDIPNYEGLYQVSNKGNVVSLNYNTTGRKGLLKQSLNGAGYYKVVLCKDKAKKTFSVHQLVAMAFLNHVPNGHKIVVDHIDENKLNNSVENLQLTDVRNNTVKSMSTDKIEPVGVSKVRDRYRARIRVNNKSIHIGYYDTQEQALRAYQEKLKEIC